ncbi:hypothetical protein ABTG69_20100, partial [Acinetobacter baumannii]
KPLVSGRRGRDEARALTQQAILALSMPFLLSDIPVRIGASAGILNKAAGATAGSPTQLLEQVDRALYAAKRAGGGRWIWSDENA